ncbi:MAG: efflux RND transporter permease subunit [Spirochaetes bacterium]|nr:efflux RND transporter permease subunit [Spirochaetota bacterium]
MIEKIIAFFVKRHLLTNFIAIGVFIAGIYSWTVTPKEELPDMEMNFVRITSSYPGASPEDVEHFITRPIEDEIQGVDGVYRVYSTSGIGVSTIIVEIEDDIDDLISVVNDINDSVNRVDLPSEVREKPYVRQFKTSQKAIIDIALVHKNKEILDTDSRRELQKYASALESRLLNLPEITSIGKSGYLKQEIQIQATPEKLQKYNISLSSVMSAVKQGHVREPAGNIEDRNESRVSVRAELNEAERLRKHIIRGGFEGQEIRLGELAQVVDCYEKTRSILKINGHEGIILNVKKSSSYGIIEAVEAVKSRVETFRKTSIAKKPVDIYILDDESRDVRERLSLISLNGAIGFIFIIVLLFLLLELKAGLWVAFGIPFSFCFTMIISYMMGFTVNNITLAAVIIVMGMIVDDAIVVAENISRYKTHGHSSFDASVKGTAYVFLPVVSSIITTCVAFLPLLMFTGRFGKFIYYIPPVISIMLIGSLIESILILPAHMDLHLSRRQQVIFSLGIVLLIERFTGRKKQKTDAAGTRKTENPDDEDGIKWHWFLSVENAYGRLLNRLLERKIIVFSFFVVLLAIAGLMFSLKMKFVMFPDEEATQLTIMAEAPEDTRRYETAKLAGRVEAVFAKYLQKEVVGFRTVIGESRHGQAVEENKFLTRIEIVSREKREKSLSQLKEEWQDQLKDINELSNIRFIEHRFGQSSGSPVEIMVQENDDLIRREVVERLRSEMEKHPALTSVEIDRPISNTEYRIDMNRNMTNMLAVKASEVSSTLRAILQGTVLYELIEGDDETDVVVTSVDDAKRDIDRVVKFPVENSGNYLVPISSVVSINKTMSPDSIQREDYKRTTKLYADLVSGSGKDKSRLVLKADPDKNNNSEKNDPENNRKYNNVSPLDIAEYFEADIFPDIIAEYPSSIISFTGEIKDTRESEGDLFFGIAAVLFLIYGILALLFNSMIKPLIIMVSIPFGAVGIILAFWLHGIAYFGFFAAVGAIGLMGVVVNDSIVMIVKLENEYDVKKNKKLVNRQISDIAKTRLRAILLTTLTTVAGLFPTAYGIAGYDSMLAEMMLAMGWGLIFATLITLLLIPSVYSIIKRFEH